MTSCGYFKKCWIHLFQARVYRHVIRKFADSCYFLQLLQYYTAQATKEKNKKYFAFLFQDQMDCFATPNDVFETCLDTSQRRL